MDDVNRFAVAGAVIGTLLGMLRVYFGINGGGWVIAKGTAWSYYLGNSIIGLIWGAGIGTILYLIITSSQNL